MASDFSVVFNLVILLFSCSGAHSVYTLRILNVQEGAGVDMTCNVLTGSNLPMFLKDGEPVQASSHIKFYPNKLIIEPIKVSDTGIYSCKLGEEEKVVGKVIVKSNSLNPNAVRITVAIVAGIVAFVTLITGIMVCKRRCTP